MNSRDRFKAQPSFSFQCSSLVYSHLLIKIPHKIFIVVTDLYIEDIRTFGLFLLDFVGTLLIYREKYAQFFGIFYLLIYRIVF